MRNLGWVELPRGPSTVMIRERDVDFDIVRNDHLLLGEDIFHLAGEQWQAILEEICVEIAVGLRVHAAAKLNVKSRPPDAKAQFCVRLR